MIFRLNLIMVVQFTNIISDPNVPIFVVDHYWLIGFLLTTVLEQLEE